MLDGSATFSRASSPQPFTEGATHPAHLSLGDNDDKDPHTANLQLPYTHTCVGAFVRRPTKIIYVRIIQILMHVRMGSNVGRVMKHMG